MGASEMGQSLGNILAVVFGQQTTVSTHLESTDPLPLVIKDITPAWLSKVLKTKVRSVDFQPAIHGTGSKILIEVAYATPATNHPPTHLCIKGGFNLKLLEMLPELFSVYRLEAQFYHHISPYIPELRLVPSYWCGVDHPSGKGQGIVILQDIKAAGYTFGDPLQTWPPQRVRAALSQLARLHAATWGARQADFPWVPREFGMRDVITEMMSVENWALRFADPAVRPPIPEAFWAHRERIVRCMRTLWSTAMDGANKMVCMVHGDAHVGNTFLDTDGQPGFLDWQCPHVNSAANDIAYFMTGALTIEDRRKHERELYGFYLEELCKAGGPRFDIEEVWDEYRKYQMHGFSWALAGPLMQPKEVVDAISERHCAAILDHQSLELLEYLANGKS